MRYYELYEDISAEADEHIFNVPSYNVEFLQAKIDKLNKIAAKINVQPITLEKVGEFNKQITGKHGVKHLVKYYQIQVHGHAPKLDGWTFIGTLDHNSQSGTMIRAVPSQSLPEKYRNADNTCDYCHTKRDRNNTYILKHDNGEIKQVGSSCLKDFLGHQNPRVYAQYSSILANIKDIFNNMPDESEEGAVGSRGHIHYSLEDVLAMANDLINQYGWISGKNRQDDQMTTADMVRHDLGGSGHKWHQNKSPNSPEIAEKAITWAKDHISNKGSISDYEHNLLNIINDNTVAWKNIGYAASLIPYYMSNVKKTSDADTKESNYVGTIGEKIKATVTLNNVKSFDGNYGTTYLHTFTDGNGNILSWFSSNPPTMETGQTYNIQGTVKDHKEFKNTKRTGLSRVKVLS